MRRHPFGDFCHLDAADFRAILAQGETNGFFPPPGGAAEPGEKSSS